MIIITIIYMTIHRPHRQRPAVVPTAPTAAAAPGHFFFLIALLQMIGFAIIGKRGAM